MGPAEIGWRVRGLLRDQLDLVRVPLGLAPRLPNSAVGNASGFEPGFICSPVDRSAWEELPNSLRTGWEKNLLHKAGRTLENRLSYFDLDNLHHGNPFDWHRDHSAGIDAPIRLSVLTNYREFSKYGDCKLVWEPNRHHQLVVLGRAYVASGDVEYAHKIVELIRSWIQANPFGYGMNWKSPLELGVRIVNWVWAIDLVRDSGVFDDELWRDILQNVYLMMWDCQRKYSRGTSANNHLIGEAAGVFIGTCYFPQFPKADEWRKRSQSILEREIIAQTYRDGCTREHAFNYEFFVIQFFTLAMLAGNRVQSRFSTQYVDRLKAMYRFMADISYDTGRPPNCGDADDGYVLDLGNLPRDALPLLAVGSELFSDTDLACNQASESAFWLFGNLTPTDVHEQRGRESVAYRDSGYFILRSSPSRGCPRMSVFFDCAELGYGPIAAHGHADCLSFCMSVDGIPVFIDPGTYDYFTYPEWRDYFRQTRAHNTVEIDGVSQSESLGPFLWGARASPKLTDWRVARGETTVSGEHDGYMRLGNRIIHNRQLVMSNKGRSLEIRDRTSGTGKFVARTFFHVSREYKVHTDPTGATISGGNHVIKLQTDGGRLQLLRANDSQTAGWVSDSYHDRVRSFCISLETPVDGQSATVVRVSVDQ